MHWHGRPVVQEVRRDNGHRDRDHEQRCDERQEPCGTVELPAAHRTDGVLGHRSHSPREKGWMWKVRTRVERQVEMAPEDFFSH